MLCKKNPKGGFRSYYHQVNGLHMWVSTCPRTGVMCDGNRNCQHCQRMSQCWSLRLFFPVRLPRGASCISTLHTRKPAGFGTWLAICNFHKGLAGLCWFDVCFLICLYKEKKRKEKNVMVAIKVNQIRAGQGYTWNTSQKRLARHKPWLGKAADSSLARSCPVFLPKLLW